MSLYNKYRPNSFQELKGQDHITKIILSHLEDNSLPHSLIFYGQIGSGKTSMARLVANYLNKSEYGLIEKDSALDGSKGDIKLLSNDIYNKPLIGNHKTYIIDEAHLLTKQAFSSLLKTIEEPPNNVTFIFTTTDFEKIPANIKSRSKSFCFNVISNSVIKERILEILNLEGKILPEEVINLVVENSSGSLRNAIVSLETAIVNYNKNDIDIDTLADILGIVGSNRLFNLIEAFILKDFKKLFSVLQCFNEEKTDPLKAIYDLQQYLMDCRIYLTLGNTITTKSDINKFKEWLSLNIKDITSKEDLKNFKRSIGGKLDIIYDSTLTLEDSVHKTSNKSALFIRYAIKLAQLF